MQNFNPQGPRGPRRTLMGLRLYIPTISIHKALAGLDDTEPRHDIYTGGFQSTRPSRASTKTLYGRGQYSQISIHKALAGLDLAS